MKKIIILTLLFITIYFNHQAQFFTKGSRCFTISGDNGSYNVLFEYDPILNEWNTIGVTGTSFIDAMAIDDNTALIYATDAGVFGTINPLNGLFQPIGTVGFGNGEYGAIPFDNIDGLTYDSYNNIMYATQRVWGSGPGTNDVLFQIDISTGKHIPNAMEDSNGNPVDYAIIQEVFDGTFGGDVYDVDDIAYNMYTGQIIAIQNQNAPGLITEINPKTGGIEAVLLDMALDDVEGLTFTYLGELYGTTGSNAGQNSNSFIFIELAAGKTTNLGKIDPGESGLKDFEACACLSLKNDMALRMVVDPANTSFPIYPGDPVTFIINIFNQGNSDNQDIVISSYSGDDLILNDPDWTDLGNSTATTVISGPIRIGRSIQLPITFVVNPTFNANELVTYAEITNSFSTDLSDVNGNLIPIPDIDSNPDDRNNEMLIVDNEIFGRGPNANEDEDDHDVASINIDLFDLALTTQLAFSQSTPVYPGDEVTFTIEVTNQGTVTAQNVNIVDYIPPGFTLSINDINGWVGSAFGPVTHTIIKPIVSGGSASVNIVLLVDPTLAVGSSLVNSAEIASAEDTYGNNPPDIDSFSDQDGYNDAGGAPGTSSDNVIMGDGSGVPGDQYPANDEDDHDPALISVSNYGNIKDVYPGDLNHDGIVNHVDHGMIGLYKTEIGPVRASEYRNIDWYPHPAQDWGTLQLNNEDIKHFDCNGDGFVDDNDWQAVHNNMDSIWTTPISPPSPPPHSDYQVMLHPIDQISEDYLIMNMPELLMRCMNFR